MGRAAVAGVVRAALRGDHHSPLAVAESPQLLQGVAIHVVLRLARVLEFAIEGAPLAGCLGLTLVRRRLRELRELDSVPLAQLPAALHARCVQLADVRGRDPVLNDVHLGRVGPTPLD